MTFNKKIQILKKSNGNCWYCGKTLNLIDCKSKDYFIVEHQNTRSNEIDNLVASCKTCNSTKGSKDVESFRSWYENKNQLTAEQCIILGQKGFDTNSITSALTEKKVFYGELK